MTTPPVTESPAVRCRGLRHRFGDHVAVDGIDLTVARGEVFGLLGPNGAGKTTTIRVLNTLLPVQEGAVEVLGYDVRRSPMAVRRLLGYVPQQLSIEAALTGRENVNWFARLFDVPRSERRSRVADALDLMGLSDAADRLASTYSGGMVRRLELAQALVNRPGLLVLDEPTVGLDPVARDGVWQRVEELRGTDRHDGAAHHPLHGGGRRPVRPGGHDARGPDPGPGHPPRAEGARSVPRRRLEDVFRQVHREPTSTTPRKEGSVTIRRTRRTAAPPRLSPGRPPGRRCGGGCPAARRRPSGWSSSQKLRHDRTEIVTRAVQPVLWMLIFGETFTRLHAIPTGGVPYLDFLAPGIIAQSGMFVAIFYGIQIIWERDAGVLTKLLVTPTPRAALILGKSFAAGIRALAQVVVVLVLSAVLGVSLTHNPLGDPGRLRGGHAGLGVLRVPVDDGRRRGAEARPAHGHRPDDHHAPVLRLERPLPGERSCRAGSGC